MKRLVWTSEQSALFGKAPDYILAAKFGVSTTAVAKGRRRLGIAPFTPPGRGAIRTVILTEEQQARLGTSSDLSIAREVGCSASAVGVFRQRLGIAPRPRVGKPWSITLTESQLSRLGKVPDKIIAAEHGCATTIVCRLRNRLGIPAHKPGSYTVRWALRHPDKAREVHRAFHRRKAAARFQEGLQQFVTLSKKLQTNEKD